MNRNRILTLPFLIVSLALAACGDPGPVIATEGIELGAIDDTLADLGIGKAAEGSFSEGAHGGEITVLVSAAPRTLNHYASNLMNDRPFMAPWNAGLMKTHGQTGEMMPDIALEYAYSTDHREVTFRLNPEARFHNGVEIWPLTAEDVAFTFNRIALNEHIKNSIRAQFLPLAGGAAEATARGLHEVSFRFAQPFPVFHRFADFPIYRKARMKPAVDAGTFEAEYSDEPGDVTELESTGPFLLSEYVTDRSYSYVRNPHYHGRSKAGQALPYLDGMRIMVIKNVQNLLLNFRTSGIGEFVSVPENQLNTFLKQKERGGYAVVHGGPSTRSRFVIVNFAGDPGEMRSRVAAKWLADDRFRQVLASTLPRDEIARLSHRGLALPQYRSVPPSLSSYVLPGFPIQLTVEAARKRLEEIGLVRDGSFFRDPELDEPLELTLAVANDDSRQVDAAKALREHWNRIGVSIDLREGYENTGAVVGQELMTGRFHLVLIGFEMGLEPASQATLWDWDGSQNVWRRPGREYDEEHIADWKSGTAGLIEACTHADPAARAESYARWQRWVAAKNPAFFTVTPLQFFAIRNGVRNAHASSMTGDSAGFPISWCLDHVFVD